MGTQVFLNAVFTFSLLMLRYRNRRLFEKISNSLSFFGLSCCGRGVRGVFLIEIGSVLASDAKQDE